MMEELLGSETDNLGNKISVYGCKYEEMSAELTAFFARQWAELLENGHATHNYIPSIISCRCIYVKSDNKIVALRLWKWDNSTRISIILSSVDKKYRRRGLLKLIVKYYDLRYINKNIISVTRIHVNNKIMLEAAKKNGYVFDTIKMIKNHN